MQTSDFPPLPALPCVSPVTLRPPPSKQAVRVAYPDNEEMVINSEVDSGTMLGNPLLFRAFLADVIKQTITAKDNNAPVDIFKITMETAGGKMGTEQLPIDAEQPKFLTS